jgi:hypothetical protein
MRVDATTCRAPSPSDEPLKMNKVLLTRVPGGPSHSILDPVLDVLLEHGNQLETPYRWGSNPTGYFCVLVKPVDFTLIEQLFDVPSSVELRRELDSVDYGLGTAVINGPGAG